MRKRAYGVESRHALGSGSRNYALLCHVYQKFQVDTPNTSASDAFTLAVEEANDNAGRSRLVPTLLVFCIMPLILVHPKQLPDQAERLEPMGNACNDMKEVVAKQRVDSALPRNVPHAAVVTLKNGNEVLMFREKLVGK